MIDRISKISLMCLAATTVCMATGCRNKKPTCSTTCEHHEVTDIRDLGDVSNERVSGPHGARQVIELTWDEESEK